MVPEEGSLPIGFGGTRDPVTIRGQDGNRVAGSLVLGVIRRGSGMCRGGFETNMTGGLLDLDEHAESMLDRPQP